MRNIPVTTCVVIYLLACSCYTPTQVKIENKSSVNKNIKVHYPESYQPPHDSLPGYDHELTDNAISIRDYYRYPVRTSVLSLDTVNRTYEFVIRPKHEVIIESFYPSRRPTYGQVFIIDNTDTVTLDRKRKDFTKRGGVWSYAIKDSNRSAAK
jgi:hypothetical protein